MHSEKTVDAFKSSSSTRWICHHHHHHHHRRRHRRRRRRHQGNSGSSRATHVEADVIDKVRRRRVKTQCRQRAVSIVQWRTASRRTWTSSVTTPTLLSQLSRSVYLNVTHVSLCLCTHFTVAHTARCILHACSLHGSSCCVRTLVWLIITERVKLRHLRLRNQFVPQLS